MKLELRSKGVPMTEDLQEHADQKLRIALSRFGHRVNRVRVCLTNTDGTKGGLDIQCTVQARLHPSGVLRIQETRGDPFAAVSRASERVSQCVARQVERLRSRRRGRVRA